MTRFALDRNWQAIWRVRLDRNGANPIRCWLRWSIGHPVSDLKDAARVLRALDPEHHYMVYPYDCRRGEVHDDEI